MLVDIAIYDNK